MEGLVDKLIQEGWVNPQQMAEAKEEAAKSGKSVWSALVKLGYATDDEITMLFAQESGIAYVRLSDYSISKDTLKLLDENYCRQNCIIPLFKIQDKLYVACGNPLDTSLVDALNRVCGCDVDPLLASSRSIMQALDAYYGPPDRVFEFERYIVKQTTLRRIGYYRESERVDLKIPVSIAIDDEAVNLRYSSAIEGYTQNVSDGGTSIGLQVFLFIPKDIKISLEFHIKPGLSESKGETIKAKGEIVHCHMEKGQRYFLGIKFSEISEADREALVKLAS